MGDKQAGYMQGLYQLHKSAVAIGTILLPQPPATVFPACYSPVKVQRSLWPNNLVDQVSLIIKGAGLPVKETRSFK